MGFGPNQSSKFINGQWVGNDANAQNQLTGLNQLLQSPEVQALTPEQKAQLGSLTNTDSLKDFIQQQTFNNQQASALGQNGAGGQNGVSLTGNAGQNALNPYNNYKVQAAQINPGEDASQNGFINALQAQMTGGNSLAQSQLRSATDQNIAQQMALARSGPGGANPLAMRNAANNAATIQQQGVNQAAGLRAQEAAGNANTLGQAIAGRRGQQLEVLGQNAANIMQAQGANYFHEQSPGEKALGVAGSVGGALVAPFTSMLSGGGGGGAAAAPSNGATGMFAEGGEIPGNADVPGNSLKNDTVPAMVSPGEIILPRSVALSPDAPDKAAEFVQAIMKRQAPQAGGFGQVLANHRAIHERLANLERLVTSGKK